MLLYDVAIRGSGVYTAYLESVMNRLSVCVFVLLGIISLASASEPPEEFDKAQQIDLGEGYIAGKCQLEFAGDRVAQTACEVCKHMEMRADTEGRIQELERSDQFLFEVADQHKARADRLEARIAELERIIASK